MAVTRVLRVRVARSASRAAEAVDRQAVPGSPGGLLGDGGGGALGLGDDAGAQRLGRLLLSVVVQHRRQALAHVPFEVVGEHAQEDVGAHALFEPVVDRPDLRDRPSLGSGRRARPREGFVALDRGGVVERGGGQAGAHDIDAVERGLGGDLGALAGEGEAGRR